MSKLISALSALKAVELGIIGLDDDICPHIPELAAKKILTGFDDSGVPVLQDRKGPITLRQLLTHSSGLSYGFHPNIVRYQAYRGRSTNVELGNEPTVTTRFDLPLVFEPGTGWMYGTGLDYTGVLIHQLTGLTLEEFQKKHFWDPLAITGLTFWPNPDLKSKQAQLTIRNANNGHLTPYHGVSLNSGSEDCFGGHGMYAQMADYLRVLRSLLANDGKLLTPASVDELFTPQLSDDVAKALNHFLHVSEPGVPGNYNLAIPVQYGLGGMLFLEDDTGRRRKGTLTWTGYYNTIWIVDREAGLAFTWATQLLPPGDPGVKEMSEVAERAVYQMAGLA
jgi:CubicO group peptidase (beta-lactamase class C family)